MTPIDFFWAAAQRHPDARAAMMLAPEGEVRGQLSYRELAIQVNAAAAAFQRVSGQRRPRICIASHNSLAMLVAIPLGILSAVKQYTWFDHIATTADFAGQSLPVFWFGLLLIIGEALIHCPR